MDLIAWVWEEMGPALVVLTGLAGIWFVLHLLLSTVLDGGMKTVMAALFWIVLIYFSALSLWEMFTLAWSALTG